MIDKRLADASWHKSTYSTGGNNCVEVASTAHATGVRDTKDRTRGSITVSPDAWSAFVSTVKTR